MVAGKKPELAFIRSSWNPPTLGTKGNDHGYVGHFCSHVCRDGCSPPVLEDPLVSFARTQSNIEWVGRATNTVGIRHRHRAQLSASSLGSVSMVARARLLTTITREFDRCADTKRVIGRLLVQQETPGGLLALHFPGARSVRKRRSVLTSDFPRNPPRDSVSKFYGLRLP
jgi:hypothetical protein